MYDSFFDPPPTISQGEAPLMENSDEEGEAEDWDEKYESEDLSSEEKKTVSFCLFFCIFFRTKID